MTKKENQKTKFQTVSDEYNLNAGICGPDGCVIDWSKADEDKKKEDRK